MPPQRVWFLRRFGPFWSGIGYSFRGTTGVYERIYRVNFKSITKKEKYANSKWIFRNLFCWRSNLSNDSIICLRTGVKTGMDFGGLVWKRVWKITNFLVWNIGSGFVSCQTFFDEMIMLQTCQTKQQNVGRGRIDDTYIDSFALPRNRNRTPRLWLALVHNS